VSSGNDLWDALVVDVDDFPEPAGPWASDDDTEVLPLTPQRDGEPWPDRAGRIVVVIGATGGAGATTVACGMALALARTCSGTALLDLDFELGDTHEAWGVPRHRTLGDLVPVLGELGPTHLDLIGYAHDSGVDLLLSPASHGASNDWGRGDLAALLACACLKGPVVVDAGRAPVHHVSVVCELAHTLVVVAPATLRGARRAREVIDRCAADKVRVVLNQPVGLRAELSSRAFAAACGRPVDSQLQSSPREAERLRSGVGGRSRRGLLPRLAELVEADAHVAP